MNGQVYDGLLGSEVVDFLAKHVHQSVLWEHYYSSYPAPRTIPARMRAYTHHTRIYTSFLGRRLLQLAAATDYHH